MKDFCRIRCTRARHPTAHVVVMSDKDGEPEEDITHEYRLKHEDVRQMHATVIRIVQYKNITFLDRIAVFIEHGFNRIRDRAKMKWQR